MKTLKVMSIIGIVFLSLSLIFIIALAEPNSPAAGWGIISSLYSIPFCIVALVQSNKKTISNEGAISDLIKLNELKEKGILTELEFNKRKIELLR